MRLHSEDGKQLLEDSAYEKLKCKPTTTVKTKISSALKELEHKGCLSNKQRLFYSPSFSVTPQIYELPKIHNEAPVSDQSSSPLDRPPTN